MNKDITGSLAWAGGLLTLGLGASFARSQGVIDGDTTTRIVFTAIGLMVAWYGNRMPKALAPSECARQVARVGGWAMAVSGLVYAGLWAFAPLHVALYVGCGAIAAGVLVTIAYCLSVRARARTA